MTDQHPAPNLRDLEVIARRAAAPALTQAVLTAAQAVVDNIGTRGALVRHAELGEALDNLAEADPVAAVLLAAACWWDRYGTAGSQERLADLRNAVEWKPSEAAGSDTPDTILGMSLEDAIESGQYTGRRQSVSDLFGDDQ